MRLQTWVNYWMLLLRFKAKCLKNSHQRTIHRQTPTIAVEVADAPFEIGKHTFYDFCSNFFLSFSKSVDFCCCCYYNINSWTHMCIFVPLRFYLLAADRSWHGSCLRCFRCSQPLDSELSCFSRDGNIYCKEDYYR